jgi:RHH-type proline utilization regulon transcriptional repressor/proline dehydrogenase/delta 1-pyrroline-5-carboxylate dehydrogenase
MHVQHLTIFESTIKNILRYLPAGRLIVHLHENDSLWETIARIAAAVISGNKLWVSIRRGLNNSVTRFLQEKEGQRLVGGNPIFNEPDDRLIRSIPGAGRIRYAAPDRVSPAVFKAAAETGYYISRTPVMMDGRLELLQYYRPQSICNNYHRYGNLGERARIGLPEKEFWSLGIVICDLFEIWCLRFGI